MRYSVVVLAFAFNKPAIGVHLSRSPHLAPLLFKHTPEFSVCSIIGFRWAYATYGSLRHLVSMNYWVSRLMMRPGEAFDKVAKMMKLPFWAANIAKLALQGDAQAF